MRDRRGGDGRGWAAGSRGLAAGRHRAAQGQGLATKPRDGRGLVIARAAQQLAGGGLARARGALDRRAGPGAGARAGAGGKRSSARTGAIIITAASVLAAVLVFVILNFDAGAGARQRAQDAAIMGPVTGLGRLARRYAAIAAPVNQQLATEMGYYYASQGSDLAAARSALRAEVTTERSFDASLATWLAAWKSDYAAAKALQTNGLADLDEPVIISIPYSSSVAGTASALLTADRASESLITRQAQAGTLLGMRSLNGAHQTAGRAVGAQAALLRKELRLPPASYIALIGTGAGTPAN
jgi:hypothetical protein